MESGLIITGWIVITTLYITMHHLYNWLSRKIDWEDEDSVLIQLVIACVYIIINVIYFNFTFYAFKYF